MLSIVFLSTLWFILRKIFPSKIQRITALALALFATGITTAGSNRGWEYIRSDSEVFQRSTILQPHYMFAAICSLLSVYFLSQAIDRKKVGLLVLSAFFGFMTTWTFPPCMAMVLCSLPIYFLLALWQKRTWNHVWMNIMYLMVFGLVSLVPYMYFVYAGNFFDNYNFLLAEHVFAVDLHWTDYVSMIGVIIVPALLALPWIIRKGGSFLILSLSWIMVHPIAVLYLAHRFSVNQVRFIQTPFFVFYAIVAVVGLREFFHFVSKITSKKITYFIGVLTICAFVIPSWYTYTLSLHYDLDRYPYDVDNDLGYPLKDEYDAMIWLGSQGAKDSIVLSDLNNGSLMLALTPLKMYATTWFGAGQFLAEAEIILPPMYNFYAGRMSDAEASALLGNNDIRYVYFGKDEQSRLTNAGRGAILPYTGLEEIYSNNSVRIYEFVGGK
jgi:hypothetical protein